MIAPCSNSQSLTHLHHFDMRKNCDHLITHQNPKEIKTKYEKTERMFDINFLGWALFFLFCLSASKSVSK